MFISDLWQVSGLLWVLRLPPTNKTDCHDVTGLLLNVALNTITIIIDLLIPEEYTQTLFCYLELWQVTV